MKTLLPLIILIVGYVCEAQNIALGKPIIVSSVESSIYPGSYANDGNSSTRWSSSWADNQWIYIDLGSSYNISIIKITWEVAYAKSYQIQTSNDALNWTIVYSNSACTGGINSISLTGMGRYVKLLGLTRSSSYGISIYELEIYGTPYIDCSSYKSTIDSLKTALKNEKYTSSWALTILNDTVTKYKRLSIIYKYSLDTLSQHLNKVLHPIMDSVLLAEMINMPITAFKMVDSTHNTNVLVTQKFYDVVPYFKFQTIHRYPIQTSQGIKTKELTMIEIEK